MTTWSEIVGRHSGLVWQTAYRLLGNHADAADCTQDAFLAAVELSRRERIRNWGGLLQQLATRKALDQLRSRAARSRLGGGPPDWATVVSPNPGPAQEAEAAELAASLRAALCELPDRQAEVFCMRLLSELSYRDIARLLGLSTSAVGVLLHRARSRLREMLSPADAATEAEVSL